MSFEQEKMIVGSLPSLYPLQKFEEEAISALVSLPIDDDAISRKAAIDALNEYGNGRIVYIAVEEAVRRIEQLPPAQPDVSDTNVGNKMQLSGESATKGTTFARGHENGLKRTEERTETHGVCLDAISRQAAIETVMECYDNAELFEVYEEKLRELPPAQPESDSGRWERHYSRPGVYADLYWHCSKCGYKTDYQYANVNHHYCPCCGKKMEKEVSYE